MYALLVSETGAAIKIFDLLVIQNFKPIIVDDSHRW
jgi:hypothetical protein